MNPNVPAGAATLLAFIYKAETGKTGLDAYRTIIGHRENKLPKPVTDFTLGELLEAQKTWGKNWRSSAAGAPQIIRKTLLDLCAKLGLKAEQTYGPDLQDRLAYELLKQRGYADFVVGKLSLPAFALALSKEWASLPVLSDMQGANAKLKRGQSWYDGDGLNGATVTPGDFVSILSEVLNDASRPVPGIPIPDAAPSIPAPPPDAPLPPPVNIPTPPSAKRSGINWWIVGAILVALGIAAVAFLPIF